MASAAVSYDMCPVASELPAEPSWGAEGPHAEVEQGPQPMAKEHVTGGAMPCRRPLYTLLVCAAVLGVAWGFVALLGGPKLSAAPPMAELASLPGVAAGGGEHHDHFVSFVEEAQSQVQEFGPDEQASVALCVDDLYQALGHIGGFGLAAERLRPACGKNLETPEEHAACAAVVIVFITELSLLTSLLSSSVSSCGLKVNVAAACSERITGLVGVFGVVGLSGASLVLSCDNIPDLALKALTEEKKPESPHRLRLPSLPKARPSGRAQPADTVGAARLSQGFVIEVVRNATDASKARQREIAFCAVATIQASGFAVRMGLGIRSAIQACSTTETEEQRRVCATAIIATIGSFGFLSSFLSLAVSSCPAPGTLSPKGKLTASCSGGISGIIAGLVSAAAYAMDMDPCEQAGAKLQGRPDSTLPVEDY